MATSNSTDKDKQTRVKTFGRRRKKRTNYTGRFIPKFPAKYRGNIHNIVYRSLWELKFMNYCDNHPDVLEWSSEEVVIAYYDPVTKKRRRYYPDFKIKRKIREGTTEIAIIEIKPKAQTSRPIIKENARNSEYNVLQHYNWLINQAKWRAARTYCEKKRYQFIILTEDNLKV